MENRVWAGCGLKGLRLAGTVAAGIAAAAGFALLFASFVMRLWNWIMPELLHTGTLTFWKAFGVVLLARLIFGSLGPSRKGGEEKTKRRRQDGKGRNCCYDGWEDWHEDWDRQDWRQYTRWWKEEGKAAFERFSSENGHIPPQGDETRE